MRKVQESIKMMKIDRLLAFSHDFLTHCIDNDCGVVNEQMKELHTHEKDSQNHTILFIKNTGKLKMIIRRNGPNVFARKP